MEENKAGYSTITYRVQLYDRHVDWLEETKRLYNRVVSQYYMILLKYRERLQMSNQSLMRELEILTVGTRDMKSRGEIPLYPLDDFPQIPLYFRRAAIHTAIGLARSYVSQLTAWEEKRSMRFPSETRTFSVSPVYYKGMYKEFGSESIMLKLYTGNAWRWVTYPFTGRELPKDARWLSPTIKLEGKTAHLHVPIYQKVSDVRTIQERMKTENKILSIAFPGNDCLAVGAILLKDGSFEKSIFLRGGKELKQKRDVLLKKAKYIQQTSNTNTAKYYKKMEQLNSYYAHKTSRELVEFCLENEIKVIAVPRYERTLDFSKRSYILTNRFEWIGRRIIRYLKYKAFANGIVVGTVRPYHITDVCSICGESIRKYNEGCRPAKNYHGGKLFLCPNGHRGNANLNAAKNIGLHFLRFYKN